MNIIVPKREIIKLHTIEQWEEMNQNARFIIAKNLGLKEKLETFLTDLTKRKKQAKEEPEWVPCHSCDKRGWVLHEPRYPGIHPSGIADPCMLKIYWTMIGADAHESIDYRLRLIFDLGHELHGLFQTYGMMGAWGDYYVPEISINGDTHDLASDFYIEGHADADNIAVVENIPNSPIFEVGVVHEYKTINSHGFGQLNKPKPEHKQQACVYGAVTQRPITWFLYMNKDTSMLKDFTIPFELPLWEAVKIKLQDLVRRYDNDDPPPPTPGFNCQSCGYSFNCHGYNDYISRKQKARR